MSKLFFLLVTLVVITAVVVMSGNKAVSPVVEEEKETPIAMERLPDTNNDLIVPDTVPGSVITSPLKVTGKARGMWYFEASFPIELQDSTGNIIASGVAQAEGEWMTENFVPFSAELIFPIQVAGSKGKLVFRKDNPSGEPKNDASVVVPVQF